MDKLPSFSELLNLSEQREQPRYFCQPSSLYGLGASSVNLINQINQFNESINQPINQSINQINQLLNQLLNQLSNIDL